MRSTHCSALMRSRAGVSPLAIHHSSFRNIHSVCLHASKLDVANAVATDDRKLSNLLAQPRSQPPEQPGEPKRSFEGVTELLFCSFFWGTYNPVMKIIYAEDHPLDPATLTAIRTVLSAAALAVAVVASQRSKQQAREREQSELASTSTSEPDSAKTIPPASSSIDGGGTTVPIVTDPVRTGILAMTFGSVVAAGMELGLYNFAGTSMQAVGLQLTSATRAGFLVQLTAVLTPALSYLTGERISPKVWLAVVVGLAGSCLVAYDGMSFDAAADAVATSPEEMKGVLLIMAACFFYSMAVVRLGMYAPRFPPVDLTAVKKFTLCTACLIWLYSQQQQGASTPPVDGVQDQTLLEMLDRPLSSWLLIVYSSLGPGAMATYLQTKGQSIVPATQAQVIFSLTPLWSALVAQITLGGETMGPLSWGGGAAVLVASVLAAQAQSQDRAEAAAEASRSS